MPRTNSCDELARPIQTRFARGAKLAPVTNTSTQIALGAPIRLACRVTRARTGSGSHLLAMVLLIQPVRRALHAQWMNFKLHLAILPAIPSAKIARSVMAPLSTRRDHALEQWMPYVPTAKHHVPPTTSSPPSVPLPPTLCAPRARPVETTSSYRNSAAHLRTQFVGHARFVLSGQPRLFRARQRAMRCASSKATATQ